MAIKEITKKIEFIAYSSRKGREKDVDPAPTVNVDRKANSLYFSKALVGELGMGGKFIRLYFEPTRKIIGWQLKDRLNDGEIRSKSWKLVKTNSHTGSYSLNIKKMLEEMAPRLGQEKYKNVPVQKYRETRDMSEYRDQIFYFVELVDNPELLRQGVGNEKIEKMSVA